MRVNDRKSRLSLLLMLALIGGTAWFLLSRQPLSSLGAALRQVRLWCVPGGLGLMTAFVGCEAMCSRLILGRLGHKVTYRQCLGYSFAGFYVSSITPSSTGGQPAQIYYMSKDGVPAAHGALDMMLIAVCYQATVVGYALTVALTHFSLVANLGGGLSLLLIYGVVVNGSLTAGMLCLMFLPNAARKVAGGVLSLLVRLHIVRDAEKAREKLERQMAEYRRGAQCVKANPGLVPVLLGLTVVQLTALFSVPVAVYHAFGLTGSSAMSIICTQALVTLAVSNLPLPGAVGASEGGFVAAMALFFGPALVTPAVLLSRGISFYAFLLVSAAITLAMHLRARRKSGMGCPPPCMTAKTGSKMAA